MNNFLIVTGEFENTNINKYQNSFDSIIHGKNFFVGFNNNKFNKDSFLYQDDSIIILLSGFILNKKYFCSKNSWENEFVYNYNKSGVNFVNQLRGSFVILVINKICDEITIFSDHIASKVIFYSALNNYFICTDNLKTGVKIYNELNSSIVTLSDIGVKSLLTYGYHLENNTLLNEFNKLTAGKFLTYNIFKKSSIIKSYYYLNNTPNDSLSIDDWVDEFDVIFTNAVKQQFEKNIEYGYRQINTLSGGLDSRSVLFAANKLGYDDILNITWAQTGSLDFKIAMNISEDLNYEWFFKSLDNGHYLLNIDDISKFNNGMSLFYGQSHQYSFYSNINPAKLGIVHTGQLGDVVLGTFYSTLNLNEKFKIGDGAYSKILIKYIKDYNFNEIYPNQEIFNFYNRGFNGANSGLSAINNFAETMSPFYNIDVLNLALTIPLKHRYRHKIYKKWLAEKHPNSTKYIWEKTNNFITTKSIKLFNREIYLNSIHKHAINFISKELYKKLYVTSKTNSMNPLDFNYNNNSKLRNYWDDYLISNLYLIPFEYRNMITELYNKGNAIEKNMAISCVSSIRFLLYDI